MNNLFISLFLVVSFSYSQYSLSVEHIGGAKHFGEENLFRAALLSNGTRIKTIERKLPFDVPFPATYINETTGIFILSYPFDGFVEVYNSKGLKIWENNFFKEMGPNYERTITVALGKNTIAFLTSDVLLQNALVHKYTIDGAKQWETKLPFSLGYEIALSPDEQTIVAGSYFTLEDEIRRSAAVISAKGTIEGDVEILFRKAAFSNSNKFIALTSEREVVVVSNETKKEISRTGKISEGIITDVIWNGENLIVQESIVKTTPEYTFYYADPLFITYTSGLKKITEQKVMDDNFKTGKLLLKDGTIQFIRNEKSNSIER